MATTMVNGTLVTTPNVRPSVDRLFPVYFGIDQENDVNKSFRHSWERQNVDIHQVALGRVTYSLANFLAKIKIAWSAESMLKIEDSFNTTSVTLATYFIHLVDFDIINNVNFKGINITKGKVSVDPKDYPYSPLSVWLKISDKDDKTRYINKHGFFYLKGDAEINFVRDEKTDEFNVLEYSHITDFKTDALCYYTRDTQTSQTLYS